MAFGIGVGPVAIFLYLLLASEGVSEREHYGGRCKTNLDCISEFSCRNGHCGCFFREPKMYYDRAFEICVSFVGWKCTLKEDGLSRLRCNSRATCTENPLTPTSLHGICKCSPGLVSANSGKQCVSVFSGPLDEFTETSGGSGEDESRGINAKVNPIYVVVSVVTTLTMWFYYWLQ